MRALNALRKGVASSPRCTSITSGASFASLTEKFQDAKTFLPLKGTDHVELFTSNARQCAHWYHTVMGFQPVAYRGLETGCSTSASYVLRQGTVRLVISAPLRADGGEDEMDDMAEHVRVHGDGIKTIALEVDDAREAFKATTERGATVYHSPRVIEDDHGEVVVAAIRTYGDTVHLFVERKNYSGIFMPGFEEFKPLVGGFDEVGIKFIDHVVGNVEKGEMDRWVKYYKKVFGFAQLLSFDDKDISTEYTALQSKVVTDRRGTVKYPINEPAEGLKKSQIEEFIDFYDGPGVQHIALATEDLPSTVTKLRQRGCEFLSVPDSYYEELEKRVGKISEAVDVLRENRLLVDRDENGYMLQIFTKPVGDRPTLFFEIIQRKGALSFGKGNFKALFESIEREQEKRGTL